MELIIIAVLFIGVFWFMNGKARKQQAAAFAFRDDLQPGQEVMTIGRMYGTVVEVNDDRVTLELSDGVVGEWDKLGIMRLVEPPLDDDELDDDELDDDELDDEFDDELDDDELDDDTIDEALAEDEAVDDASGDDATNDDEWPEVEVPDDASSLTDHGTDENKPS